MILGVVDSRLGDERYVAPYRRPLPCDFSCKAATQTNDNSQLAARRCDCRLFVRSTSAHLTIPRQQQFIAFVQTPRALAF